MADDRQFLVATSMRALLRKAVRDAGSCTKFCERHRLSPGTINAATQGVRPITSRVARVLGYEPLRVYRRIVAPPGEPKKGSV